MNSGHTSRRVFADSSARVSAGIFPPLLLSIFLNRGFARVSPVFAVGGFALFLCASFPAAARPALSSTNSPSSADPSAAVRRQAATSQFARAEEQRSALYGKPSDKRTLADYKQVVNSYRRVYLITPHAAEVPDALLAVAELYTEMGDRFGRAYYQSAVDTYQFLMREYPKSRYCEQAYLRSAKLQKDQLGDTTGAIKTYDTFLKKYPRSKQRREAQEARAELALLQKSADEDSSKSAIAKSAGSDAARENAPPPVISRDVIREAPRESAAEAAPAPAAKGPTANGPTNGRVAQVRNISAKGGPDSERVTIELGGTVQYTSGRIANPDRIFFDFHAARLAPSLVHAKIKSDSQLISGIRVAQNPSGVVRVVLDVNGVKDYTASLLNASGQGPSRLIIDLYANAKATQTAQGNPPANDVETSSGSNATAKSTEKPAPLRAPKANGAAPTEAPTENAGSASVVANTIPQPRAKLGSANAGAKGGKKPDLIQPASTPQPTRDGQSTLTRTLGLKIGRIVIDPGHGGHDTGTIGPTGLMEKDLCLDVALRLGKLIQQKLPGAEVVFTRSDDSFIPLEERTHIANEAKADMFISIHANSSHDPDARGIETYYLNLKGSPEAMEVAARENATSDQGIHELEDLVKQIARTEKIEESREFAQDVQDSLAKRVQKSARPVKNRGVRKAPFVVLIGADMPSILTEISFLSNPSDEKLLKQPEHRQRVAEGIFQGIAGYLQNLNSVNVSHTSTPVARKTTTSAASELDASRNRN